MTNADRIRSMTDEELADFLDNNVPDCARLCPDFKAGCSFGCQHNQGKDFLIAWLKSEEDQAEIIIDEKCANCHWYWRNNDTENECKGSDSVCHEFIPKER